MQKPVKESALSDDKIGNSRHNAIRHMLFEMGVSRISLNVLSDDELVDLLVGLRALARQDKRCFYRIASC